MPSNPKMDEQALLLMLRDESITLSPLMMRQLCAMVVLDCWDRKVERGFFASVLDLCVELDSTMAVLEKGGALRYCLTTLDESRQPAMLDAQLQAVVLKFMRKRHQLADKFSLVCECPRENDTVS